MNEPRHPLDSDLDRLFSAYRDACAGDACAGVDASPQFMPHLWARIESRRDSMQPLIRRLTQFFAGLAAAASFALLALMLLPQETEPATYVEVLAQSHRTDRAPLPYAGYVDVLSDPDAEIPQK